MQTSAQPANEAARLSLLQSTALLDSPAEVEFDRIAQFAAQILQMPMALISLIDHKRQWIKASVGLDIGEMAREVSFCAHIVTAPGVWVIHNALHDTRFTDNPLVSGEANVRFYAGAPLLLHADMVIGTLCVMDDKTRPFSLLAQQQLQLMADTVCELIRKRTLIMQMEQRLHVLQIINQAQSDFLWLRDMGSTCNSILQPLLGMSCSTLGFIASSQTTVEGLPYLDILGLAQADQAALGWLMPKLTRTVSGHRLYGFEQLFAPTLSHGEIFTFNRSRQAADPLLDGVDSLLVMPCFFDLSLLGILVLVNRPGGFDDKLVEQLTVISDSIGSLLHICERERERQAAEAALATQATLDPLTGLMNRRAFLGRLQHSQQLAQRYQQNYSLIMLDLDFFKQVNDRYGHAAGDEVLKTLSALFQSLLRDTDVVCRWGGEEFCLLLPCEDGTQAMLLAQRLVKAIQQCAIRWEEQTLSITASLGVASYQSGESVDNLLRRADDAMYAAKTAGRNCCKLSGE